MSTRTHQSLTRPIEHRTAGSRARSVRARWSRRGVSDGSRGTATPAPLTPSAAFPVDPADTATQAHAATILGRAFVDDPMFVTTLTHPVRRVASLPLVFAAMARQTAEHGVVDVTDDGHGAALWIRDDGGAIGTREVLRYGYVRFGLTAGLPDALRLSRVQDSIVAHHHELLPEPHGYAYALGVEPGHQGRGVGSELLMRGCARLDALHLPGYLETNLVQNVRLYARHGFEVARYLPADDAKPFETWLMIRPAR